MKFLAILRDSLREALDAKVIYALFVLSALAIVAAFSISFKAEPGEKGLKSILNQLPGAVSLMGPAPLSYEIEDFKQLNEGKPAWEGDYHYTLVVTENELPKEPDEDEDEDKGKKARPPEKQPSVFRVLVLAALLQEKNIDNLSDEDLRMRERLGREGSDVLKGKTIPTRRQLTKLNQLLIRESERITDDQLARFLKRQLGASGTLDVDEVKLVGKKEREFRFDVQSKAKPDAIRTWPHEVSVAFGATSLPIPLGVGDVIYILEDKIVGGIGAGITMLLGTIVTAFFIPNMLRKGTIDLLIAKPIHRWYLMVCKYLGGMLFVLIPTVIVVVGIWLALGLRSGFWGSGFLLSIPILIFQFAIFYAVSTFVGVLTRSPILCILAGCFTWGVLWLVPLVEGWTKPAKDDKRPTGWVYKTAETTRKILPRYKDLDTLSGHLVAQDLLGKDSMARKLIEEQAKEVHWAEALTVTLAYIVALLAASCLIFTIRDY